VHLDEYGRSGVWALDGYSVKGLGDETLFSRFLEQGTAPTDDSIDVARSKQLRKVAEGAGFVSIPKVRMAGHYALDRVDPLSEGKGWQDVLASHPTLGLKRRLRLFDIPKGTSSEKRSEIEQHAKREHLLTQGISNPGIVAPLEYLDTDSGPSLVFALDKDEVPLDDTRLQELGWA
jgi:hypothetical protein